MGEGREAGICRTGLGSFLPQLVLQRLMGVKARRQGADYLVMIPSSLALKGETRSLVGAWEVPGEHGG